MKTYKFNGLTLVMYEGILDLPVKRFQMFNLNAMIDAGIGSDLGSFDNHTNRIVRLIDIDDKDSAKKQLRNQQQNVHFIMSNISPEFTCFAAVIHKIDGREITDDDLLGDGVDKIMTELSRKKFSITNLRGILKEIKKKIQFETSQFFPDLTDDSGAKVVYTKLKLRTDLLLQSVEKGLDKGLEKIEKQISQVDDFILSLNKPKVYSGSDGLEVTMIKNFERTCTLFEFHNLSNKPKELTALSFLEKTVALKDLLKNLKKKSK